MRRSQSGLECCISYGKTARITWTEHSCCWHFSPPVCSRYIIIARADLLTNIFLPVQTRWDNYRGMQKISRSSKIPKVHQKLHSFEQEKARAIGLQDKEYVCCRDAILDRAITSVRNGQCTTLRMILQDCTCSRKDAEKVRKVYKALEGWRKLN